MAIVGEYMHIGEMVKRFDSVTPRTVRGLKSVGTSGPEPRAEPPAGPGSG